MIPQFRNTQRGIFKQIFAYGDCTTTTAQFALTVRLNTPPDHEKDFNTWYDEDHVPALVGVPGVYCARRYHAVDGDPKYLAIYEMNTARFPRRRNGTRRGCLAEPPKFGRTSRTYKRSWRSESARESGCAVVFAAYSR